MEGIFPSSTHPLSQVLCAFLLNLLQRISAQPLCRQEEFSVGDECCPMCNPGRSSQEAVLCQGRTPVLSLWASGFSVQWLHSVQFRNSPWQPVVLSVWALWSYTAWCGTGE